MFCRYIIATLPITKTLINYGWCCSDLDKSAADTFVDKNKLLDDPNSPYANIRITEDLPKIGSQRVDRIPQCN